MHDVYRSSNLSCKGSSGLTCIHSNILHVIIHAEDITDTSAWTKESRLKVEDTILQYMMDAETDSSKQINTAHNEYSYARFLMISLVYSEHLALPFRSLVVTCVHTPHLPKEQSTLKSLTLPSLMVLKIAFSILSA